MTSHVWEFTTSDKYKFCIKALTLDQAKHIALAFDPKSVACVQVDEQTQRERGRAIYGIRQV